MNTTATSEPTPATEVSLTRSAKVELLRQMYSRAHWIELIRLIGHQTIPLDKAQQAIKPLAETFGKEPIATAGESLVEIFMQSNVQYARLKSHVRRMAFQIIGPGPSTEATLPPPNERRHARKPAEVPATDEDTPPPSTVGGDALMQQYRAAKEKHPGMLLLFRIGNFVELFGQDAETAHKLLGLTLTTRDRTLVIAGFPHHQLEVYLHKLLKEGQRVAICEPLDETLAHGPIRREVTRVVTPGTMIEGDGVRVGDECQTEDDVPIAEGHAVRQPRHFVLKQFKAWLNEAGLAFVAIEDVRQTTPAVAPYVGVLDFIVMRGDEKLLVTVRPNLLAKHLKAIRELQNLFGPEYKPTRMWPNESPNGWAWHDYAVDVSATEPAADAERKPRRKRSRANAPQ